ncbi:MAG: 50S ribosomal protein L6 [Blastochloris sp.]|nr:50S ribosomal protein L6 [Blastochloris sp.]
MSRIGNKTILIPDKVKVQVQGRRVNVEGPKGKMEYNAPEGVDVEIVEKEIRFKRKSEEREVRALHGLARSLVNNMVQGTLSGFQKRMEIQGVGFKAAVQGKNLNLSLGYSHPLLYPIPSDIKITVEDQTKLLVEGVDKQKVGQVCADIRAYYPPEPYKGKGVRFAGENVRRKEGKTAQSK